MGECAYRHKIHTAYSVVADGVDCNTAGRFYLDVTAVLRFRTADQFHGFLGALRREIIQHDPVGNTGRDSFAYLVLVAHEVQGGVAGLEGEPEVESPSHGELLDLRELSVGGGACHGGFDLVLVGIDPLDGLAHCKRCHKPRQKVYPFMDSTKILPFPCPCIEDRWDQEDALREHRELLTRIAWLKSCGLQDKTLYHYKLKDLYSGDYSVFFKNLRKYELLIWDDFGADRGSLFSLEQIYRVIDAWYRTQKPLIITTNLTLNELKMPPDVNYARIYSRILERCVPVKINNLDIRTLIAKSQLSDIKAMTAPT